MALDWAREAIDQLEWHWRGALRPRLEGLTDEECFWEPVPGCWSIRPRAEAASPAGPSEGPFADRTYAALVLHISREVIHHGAEVALLRDLYAHRFAFPEGART